MLSTIASTAPLPRPESESEIAEHYNRCQRIGVRIARRVGVADPEAVYHDAYRSILNDPKPDTKKWPFLPKRIKDRAKSAYRSQANRDRRLPTVPIGESHSQTPESPRMGSGLPWIEESWRILLEPLTNQDLQAVVLFHFLGWSVSRIASVGICGSTPSAVKTRLHRIRAKIRAFSIRPQPSAD
ncbi:MAG: sigma-70 family RNA polymerase sigma factor [Limisphaerales bacterium]